jgi:hypothetical protein
MAFAAPPDVAARLGRSLTADETTQVEALLEDAEAMILKRVPDLQARVTAGTLTTATIVRIESNSVRRVMVNPTGIRSHSEGLGDFQQSDTFDSSISTGELYVDDNAWADLAGTPESVRVHHQPRLCRDLWDFPVLPAVVELPLRAVDRDLRARLLQR